MIGIDKIILNNVEVIDIDWQRFDDNPACIVKLHKDNSSRSESGVEFSRLQVNTVKKIFYFDASTALDANIGQLRPYQKLFINPASVLYGENICNIRTASELQKAIDIVCSKLKDDCGITICTANARISNIEINANIQLDREFYDYAKAFVFIRSALPKRYKKISEFITGGETTGFLAGNTQVCLKFYDKQREAAITADVAGKILRIEYTFKTQEKVKGELGYDTLKELLDNFTTTKAAYAKNVHTDILASIPKALGIQIKGHKRKLYKAMETQPRSYLNEWLAISQSIFDYELLHQALKLTLHEKKLTARNNRERIKQMQQLVERRQEDESEPLFGQLELLNEITQKMTAILGTR